MDKAFAVGIIWGERTRKVRRIPVEAKTRVKRTTILVAAIIAIAGGTWVGIRQHRKRMEQRKYAIDCEYRNGQFSRRVEAIKLDAKERLKIGTKKAAVSQFFAEHGIPFTTTESWAIGTLYGIGGCAPVGCGTDQVLIGVRVKIDADGTVAGEPEVVDMYLDCV